MKYWLMKSEPETFSIDDLMQCDGSEPWDGIRNYQARNFMRDDMSVGDKVFFYHSNCEVPAIVGIATITSEVYPDESQFNPDSKYYDAKSTLEKPRWLLRDIGFVEKFQKIIPLALLKTLPELSECPLVRKGNRLSIIPIEKPHWDLILKLAKLK